ncbi:MAG: hypothetical protein QOG18_625, partial [Microbacteriaceae bacterium]|nr:hypothetical protein [Microbacteriaceae bacterium]
KEYDVIVVSLARGLFTALGYRLWDCNSGTDFRTL